MNDLTCYTEYTQALRDRCMAYFFMRGVEAHFAGHPQPVYKYDEEAVKWYKAGRKYAVDRGFSECVGNSSNHRSFCVSFLAADCEFGCKWGTVGVQAREYFEFCYGKKARKQSIQQIPTSTKRENIMDYSNTLYKVIADETYGYIRGKDSKGRLLLEVKGVGNIIAYTKEELEEVTPYTVEVRGGASNLERHYLSEDGLFAVGDVLVFRTNNGLVLGEVIKVNSKYKDAGSELSSVILGVLQMRAPVKEAPSITTTTVEGQTA